MLPKHPCRMQHQKMTRYMALSNVLLLNEKVQYLAVANVVGEIVEILYNNRLQNNNILSKEKLSDDLHKISFSTSMLTFENIRLMVLDMSGSKAIVVNLAEDTIIVGMSKESLLSDVANIFRHISEEIDSS